MLGISLGLLMLFLIAWIFVQQRGEGLLREQVDALVQNKTGGRYQLDMGRLSVVLPTASLTIRDLAFRRDSTVQDSSGIDLLDRFDIDLKLERLELRGFDWWNFVRQGDIAFSRIHLEGPALQMRELAGDAPAERTDLPPDTAQQAGPALRVRRTTLAHGAFTFFEAGRESPRYRAEGLQIDLGRIARARGSELTLPLDELELGLDRLGIQLGDYTSELTASGLQLQPERLHLDSLYYGTRISPAQLNIKFGYLKSWIRTTLRDVELEGFRIADMLADSSYQMETLRVAQADFRLIRDRQTFQPPPTYKPLPVELIRDIPVPVRLDSLLVDEALIEVEILSPKANQAGVLTFEKSRIRVANVTNMEDALARKADLTAQAESMLMGDGRVDVELTFHLDRPNGDFEAYVHLHPMPLPNLNEFFEREVLMSISKGNLKRIEFGFQGDNDRARGQLDFEYNDLKFRKLSPNRAFLEDKPTSGLVVAAANLVVPKKRDASRRRYRQGTIDLERRKDRDLVAFVVDALADGVLSSWGFHNVINKPDKK